MYSAVLVRTASSRMSGAGSWAKSVPRARHTLTYSSTCRYDTSSCACMPGDDSSVTT
jgi:hypothetical protein